MGSNKKDKTESRAHMPEGSSKILNRRNLSNANRRMLSLIKEGMKIIDIGCGSGSITADIAAKLNGNCDVVGMDINEQLISEAKVTYAGVKGLSFVCCSIDDIEKNKFDIVNACRMLQWIPDYKNFLGKMYKLLKPGGILHVLDYNHEKAEWTPELPASMDEFYKAFLSWRKDAGMDNEIVDKLELDFIALELKNIKVTDQIEYAVPGDPALEIWGDVARHRGPEIVKDGFIEEDIRVKSYKDYRVWIDSVAKRQKLYLKSIEGTK